MNNTFDDLDIFATEDNYGYGESDYQKFLDTLDDLGFNDIEEGDEDEQC